MMSSKWRHNGHDGVSYHHPHDCLLNRLFRHRWKNRKAPPHWPLWGEFPAQRASIAEKVSIWWRHHGSSSFNVWSSSRFFLGLWKGLPQYHISNIEQYGWIIYIYIYIGAFFIFFIWDGWVLCGICAQGDWIHIYIYESSGLQRKFHKAPIRLK